MSKKVCRGGTFRFSGDKEKKRKEEKEDASNIPEAILSISKNAIEIITDCGYLRVLRIWRETLARKVSIPITEVETDVVVPVFAHLSSRPKLRFCRIV